MSFSWLARSTTAARAAVMSLLLVACTALGCHAPPARIHAEPPEGFARYSPETGMRAVSPDGVVYRVRVEPNQPRADLAFWRAALRHHMADVGYRIIGDGPIEDGKLPGYWLEMAAPYGEQDHSYLMAIFVQGDSILIAEGAGEVSRFEKHRGALMHAIRTVEKR